MAVDQFEYQFENFRPFVIHGVHIDCVLQGSAIVEFSVAGGSPKFWIAAIDLRGTNICTGRPEKLRLPESHPLFSLIQTAIEVGYEREKVQIAIAALTGDEDA